MIFASTIRARCVTLGMAAAVFFAVPVRASENGSHRLGPVAAPTVRDFMQALDAQIQRAKPRNVFRRTIVFADVRAGAPEGTAYPFTTTATIHDYNPGWPPDHYFGKTCIARIVGGRYNMHRDRMGEWIVEMKEIPAPLCTDNPAEGKSAYPLDDLRGMRVGTSVPLPETMTKKSANVNLRLGEYACTRPGGRLASQMRFRLDRDKTYAGLEGTSGGKYTFDLFTGTLTFHGGFMDKMSGKAMEDQSVFKMSPTLICAPWG